MTIVCVVDKYAVGEIVKMINRGFLQRRDILVLVG